MSDYLKDIIDQIIEVDSLAFENKKNNEQILSKKKQEYEEQINSYRTEKLELAKKNAQRITQETEDFIAENEKTEKIEIQKISSAMDKKYNQAENDLIAKIFNKLFVLEG